MLSKEIGTIVEESVHSDEIKTELKLELNNCINHIDQWKSHILRTCNQDGARIDILDNLQSNQALVVLDRAMKFLPAFFREKQSDWYGQKRINLHVAVCIYKDEEGNLNVSSSVELFILLLIKGCSLKTRVVKRQRIRSCQ